MVEAGGYAQAADSLHKSQSAVTYAIQRIEALLAVKVFEIQGRRAVLTPAGTLLVRRARVLLEDAAMLERAAGSISAGWEAEIRLAVEIIFPVDILLGALQRFAAASPHTRIEVIESVLGGTAEALIDGGAQLAVTPQVPPGYFGEPLMQMRMLLVTAPDHPLQHLGHRPDAADLRAHRHLVVRDSGSRRDRTPLALEAQQRWTFTHMTTSMMAARRGHGFAWLPEEKICEELRAGTLKPLAIDGAEVRHLSLYLVHADADAAGPGVRHLARLLREQVAAAAKDAEKPE